MSIDRLGIGLRPRLWWVPVAAGVLVMVAAAGWCRHRVPAAYGLLGEDARIGAQLARGQGFRSPVSPGADAPPSSWLPPLYPWVMGEVFRRVGVLSPASLDVLLGINVVCLGLLVVEAERLAAGAFAGDPGVSGRRRAVVAAVAALAVAGDPSFTVRTEFFGNSYPALLLFAWLTRRAVQAGRRPSPGARGWASGWPCWRW